MPVVEPRRRPTRRRPRRRRADRRIGRAAHQRPRTAGLLPRRPPPPVERPYSDKALLTKYTDYDRSALRDAWALVSDRADKLVSTFYAELFVRLREAPTMFPSSMTAQRQEFGKALVQWVVTDDPDAMSAHLQQLGADHRKFDVEPRHYEVAGAALASAWKTLAGDRWTQRHESAVIGSYTRLASTMLDGAMKHLHEPASWGASVVDHQQILSDFAVIRIQPDEPYPYKAGQYLTLEVPSQRRRVAADVDRQRAARRTTPSTSTSAPSVASASRPRSCAAPRSATGCGSVRRAATTSSSSRAPCRPGCCASPPAPAPRRSARSSSRCCRWREPPTQLDVFVGGRTREDIYPVESLNRMIQSRGQFGRARAHGVVSDDPSFGGYRGRVESVVPILRDWASLGVDVLVAGPNPMIEATVTNLTVNRVPLNKIHFDQYESSAA